MPLIATDCLGRLAGARRRWSFEGHEGSFHAWSTVSRFVAHLPEALQLGTDAAEHSDDSVDSAGLAGSADSSGSARDSARADSAKARSASWATRHRAESSRRGAAAGSAAGGKQRPLRRGAAVGASRTASVNVEHDLESHLDQLLARLGSIPGWLEEALLPTFAASELASCGTPRPMCTSLHPEPAGQLATRLGPKTVNLFNFEPAKLARSMELWRRG